MNKKILLSCVVFLTSIQATASRDEFEPVFKRPTPISHSLTKIATGALSLFAGDSLWAEDSRLSPQHMSAEGLTMVGHTLIIDGVMGLLHWGYDWYMRAIHQNNHTKTHLSRRTYTQQPRTEKEEQEDDLRWNKITTIGQSLSNTVINTVGTHLLFQASSEVLNHDLSLPTKIILPIACGISASLTAYYAHRTYKAYHAKGYIPGEPPFLSFLTSLNQGIAARQVKESFGLTYSVMRVLDPNDCPRTPNTLMRTQIPNIETMDRDSLTKLIPLVDYYVECKEPIRGSIIATKFAELVVFHGEFKNLSSALQMIRNGITGFVSQPQVTTKSALPPSADVPSRAGNSIQPPINPRNRPSIGLRTTETSTSSDHSPFIVGSTNETSSPRLYSKGKPQKQKRRGTPNLASVHNNSANTSVQNPPEIRNEDPKRTQGLGAIAEYRNFNSVKIKHINALLREVCNFVQGETKPVKGQGSWHALTFARGSQRIKIKFEVPHAADNGVYKGFKLKRVLNAVETAYMYGWDETGIKAYLDDHGMSSFYTVPSHLIHILWRPADL